MPRNPGRKKIDEARYRRENLEWFRAFERRRHLRRAYGLTEAAWAALFEAQGKCCAVCRTDFPTSKTGWHTDHIMLDGKPVVRGILCHHCNLTVHKNTTPTILRACADYLEHHNVDA